MRGMLLMCLHREGCARVGRAWVLVDWWRQGEVGGAWLVMRQI